MKTFAKVLAMLFALIFVVAFAAILITTFSENLNNLDVFAVVAGGVALIAALALLCLLFKRIEHYLRKNYKLILAVFLVAMFAIEVILASELRFTPIFDLGAVYNGAVEWAETGSFTSQYEYFYYFPNNFGLMTIYAGLFGGMRALGVTDYFMVASVLNALCSVLMMLFAFLIVKKLFAMRYAFLMLVIFALSLPFYSVAAAFYTDALSMLFPVLVFYLFLRGDREDLPLNKRIMYGLLMGLFCSIGMLIKFTVVIAPIAIVIYLLLKGRFKNLLIFGASTAVVTIAAFLALNAIIYPAHLDKQKAAQINTPYLHWTMMGFSGSGGYNPGDYDFTRSFTNTDERDAAIKQEIAKRIDELGFKGVLNLFLSKATRSFGEPTYASSDFLDDSPANKSDLHQLLLYEGKDFSTYRNLCAITYYACMLLMIISAINTIFRFKSGISYNIIPLLCVFGIMLFLLFWECNGRYTVNFVPMMLISAVAGMDALLSLSIRKGKPAGKA